MKIDAKKLERIMDMAKIKFVEQPTQLFWQTEKGEVLLTQEEKRIIAILEGANIKLGLGLEVDYHKRT